MEMAFPLLQPGRYKITSPITKRYNCIAWAAHEDIRCWWPDPLLQYYWPSAVKRVCTVPAFIEAYVTVGYEVCDRSDYEPGYEKIAIYTDSQGTPTHASRQIGEGKWTSKLGPQYDIEHEFEALDGNEYGNPKVFMRRPY